MISSVDANDSCLFPFLNSSPGIKEGVQLLDYLASYQNHAALARKRQIQALQECLPPFIEGIGSAEMDSQTIRTPQTETNNVSAKPISHPVTRSSNWTGGCSTIRGYYADVHQRHSRGGIRSSDIAC